jgi:hypothetical protein
MHQQRWDAAEEQFAGREHEARWWWLTARHAGVCVQCGSQFDAGEVIAYRRHDALAMCEACVPGAGVRPLVSQDHRRHALV